MKTNQEEQSSSTRDFRPDPLPKKFEPRQRESIAGAYWQKPDGTILASPIGPETAQGRQYVRKGFKCLEEYSYTDRKRNDGSLIRLDYEADEHKNPWYWFLANGGAKLFPAKQVIELGWDVNPPYGMPIEAFPQIVGLVPDRWECPQCPGKLGFVEQSGLLRHAAVSHKFGIMEMDRFLEKVEARRAKLTDKSTVPA